MTLVFLHQLGVKPVVWCKTLVLWKDKVTQSGANIVESPSDRNKNNTEHRKVEHVQTNHELFRISTSNLLT